MKKLKITTLLVAALTMLGITAFTHRAWAEDKGMQDLAKAAQNPIADMITLPLQDNTNFRVGPGDGSGNLPGRELTNRKDGRQMFIKNTKYECE